jgi:hypothetical protein
MGPGDPPSSSMPNVLVIGTPFSFILSGLFDQKCAEFATDFCI